MNRDLEADVTALSHDVPTAPAFRVGQQLGQGMTLGAAGGLRVVVLTEPAVPGTLECDAVPLVNCRPVPCSVAARASGAGYAIRPHTCYADVVSGLELLCVQG